jgi:hypothetical protein
MRMHEIIVYHEDLMKEYNQVHNRRMSPELWLAAQCKILSEENTSLRNGYDEERAAHKEYKRLYEEYKARYDFLAAGGDDLRQDTVVKLGQQLLDSNKQDGCKG